MGLIRSVSGVRGLAGTDITDELARSYGRAFGSFVGGGVAVGRDGRPSGGELAEALIAGLMESGSDVRELGIVPTPTVGITVRLNNLRGGVAVTASHNPQEYNGLKFFSERGVFLTPEEASSFLAFVDGGRATYAGSTPERAKDTSAVDAHVALILGSDLIDVRTVSARALKVVVDCVNGAGSVILPGVLKALGCDVVAVNCEPNGEFVRGPEPTPENLSGLSDAVTREHAAVGFACDPDADRLAIVDETGRPLGEELTLAIVVRYVLSRRKGPIVANVSTSRMIDDVGREFGVPVRRTPVGEINVVEEMLRAGAVVGGEGNGGVILPDVQMGRDAATAAALVVAAMVSEGVSGVSQLASDFTRYHMIKRKMSLTESASERLVDAIRPAFSGGALDLTDGMKISWPDGWIHVRMSGTEPVARIISEARGREFAESLVETAERALSRQAEGGRPCAE